MRAAVALLFAAVVALLVWCVAIDARQDRLERAHDLLAITIVRES